MSRAARPAPKTRAGREVLRELVGLLRVLDLLDRHFLRHEPKGGPMYLRNPNYQHEIAQVNGSLVS